jgi:hypothetical protein
VPAPEGWMEIDNKVMQETSKITLSSDLEKRWAHSVETECPTPAKLAAHISGNLMQYPIS